jgi:predicted Fe-Mo cluster-binding NifX family protein
MTIAIAITSDGEVGGGWGRAHFVAIANVADGAVTNWDQHEVAWDVAHDEGTEGSHHARIATFLREHDVDTVVAGHMGDGMVRMLATMSIATHLGLTGDAHAAAIAAAG